MVRTRADGGSAATRKVVAARAPRKALGGASSSSASVGDSPTGKGKYAGGNPYCPRPTPDWQKGIGGFLKKKPSEGKENSEPQEQEMEPSSCEEAGPSTSCIDSD